MTSWEREILVVLANHLRILSLAQLARTWWFGQEWGSRSARQSARALTKDGWLKTHQVLSRPVTPLAQPLVFWMRGNESPDFEELSRRLHKRARAEASVTTVVVATRKTRELFGSGGATGQIKLTQTTHDLHVGEVFLSYRQHNFDQRRWVGEDAFRDSWPIRQRPDALLLDEQGNFTRAVEYGGDYSVERLATLHDALARIGMSYEIW